jgi:hypothetical protein
MFEPVKKHLFLDISSTNMDTLFPSFYQFVETRSIAAFLTFIPATSAYPFQPLRYKQNLCHQGGYLADQTDGSH